MSAGNPQRFWKLIGKSPSASRQKKHANGWPRSWISDDAIISKTLDGIISAWNLGAEKVFGYSAAEAVGMPMVMLMPEERVEEEVEILACIARGESVEHFETVRLRKDGARIDVRPRSLPFAIATGRLLALPKLPAI